MLGVIAAEFQVGKPQVTSNGLAQLLWDSRHGVICLDTHMVRKGVISWT